MIAIIGKIVICLVIALLLGFLIGWFFSKALEKVEEGTDVKSSDDMDNLLNIELAELEMKYEQKKALVTELSDKNRELKGELMKKISLLESTSNTLKNLQTNTLSSQNNSSDFTIERVSKLEQLLEKKNRELIEFETVLLKAEETIEDLKSK